MCLPVLPIKAANGHTTQRAGLHCIERHRVAVWVGAWTVKRDDSTRTTKEVPCCASVEAVLYEIVCAAGDGEAHLWHNDVRVALQRAD